MKNILNKIGQYFKNRFTKFSIHDYIISGVSLVLSIFGLYFSIGMSVSLSKGLTLFGDTSYTGREVETSGPTQADKIIITLFWIFTMLALLFTIFYIFIYKVDREKPKPKDVIDFTVEEISEEAVDE